MNQQAVALVKAFADNGKPVASICHGPWTLVEAGVQRGKTVTSWPRDGLDPQYFWLASHDVHRAIRQD